MYVIRVILFFSATAMFAQQDTVPATQASYGIADFFPDEKTPVLVVGTFHFDYPGLDAHQTAADDRIDVLKDPKRGQVTELVDYLKHFRPTKIAIEARPQWNATEKLREYKSGLYLDERDERFQIAMRIANDLSIDTLFSIDVQSMVDDIGNRDSMYIDSLFKDFDFKHEDPYNQYYSNWLEKRDELIPKTNLLDYFKQMNSREAHKYGYGAYLIGDFKLDDYRGADILSIWWYNRNLRIFRALQSITESHDDRIMVLIGNGHAAILRQLLECSPEYEFVEFGSLE